MITTEIINDTEAFRKLRIEWTELLNTSSTDCLFLTWEWMYTWWQCLSGKHSLHIILVRRNGLLIALAPLALSPSRLLPSMPFRMLEFIASGSVGSDYLGIIFRKRYEDDSLRAIETCLGEAGHAIEFVHVDKTSFPMVGMVLQLRQAGWKTRSMTTNYCPYASIVNLDWEAYLNTLHRTHRADVVNNMTRLHKEFSVEFRTAGTEMERQQAMDTFITLHSSRKPKHEGSISFEKPEQVDFHKIFSRRALQQGWLGMHTLCLDDIPVASLYTFHYHGVCYYYQAAFDREYAKYSVEMTAVALCIKHAIQEKDQEFDFLHDNTEHKYLWCINERELISLELFPPKSTGRIYQKALVMTNGLKRLLGNIYTPLLGS
jgi:CelD/BcsL family acetyltransferase involved in cellulose biosynthesis